jgi:catechol 2,3-dioxygenase-like lactoylglutathione lyase family enzyme
MLRRDFVALAAGLAGGGAMRLLAQEGPVPTGISHLSLGVSDVPRAVAFYATLFGAQLREEPANGSTVLRLGSSLLLLQGGGEGSVLQHSFALEQSALQQLHPHLRDAGIRWQDQPDGSLLVQDGDNVLTRIGEPLDWSALAASSMQVSPGKPVFDPLLIDEIFITVTNMQVDSMFYARLLDQTSTAVAGSQYFRLGAHAQLRLSQAAVGQPAGFTHFSVLVANTDMEAAAEAVFKAGGIVESFVPDGFSFWDPDGLRVVVRSVPQVLDAAARYP